MKIRIFAICIATLLTSLSLTAQGGRYGNGGMGGGRPPQGAGAMYPPNAGWTDNNVTIMNMPQIEGVSFDNHLKLTDAVANEQKDVLKLTAEKNVLLNEINQNKKLSAKDVEKRSNKITDIDVKIAQTHEKYDKKVRAILTPDQYEVFLEKKSEIKFSGNGRANYQMTDGDHPRHHNMQNPPTPDQLDNIQLEQ